MTNASTINSTTSGEFFMNWPDDLCRWVRWYAWVPRASLLTSPTRLLFCKAAWERVW